MPLHFGETRLELLGTMVRKRLDRRGVGARVNGSRSWGHKTMFAYHGRSVTACRVAYVHPSGELFLSTSGLCPPVVGALLAGGNSRRMGQPKGELRLGDRPLAAWPAGALQSVSQYCIQVGGAPLGELSWPRVPDGREAAGPAAGLEAALLYAPGAAVAVCAIDVPFVPAELLRHALDRVRSGAPAAAPHWNGTWHPLCGAVGPQLLPALTRWLDSGRRDLQALFDSVGAEPISAARLRTWGEPEVLLMNVNTPEDLARAARQLER